MKKSYLTLLFVLILHQYLHSQNVGIGTTSPRGPLSFPPTSGQKIILWDDGNVSGNNYGIGIQSGFLQLHAYTELDNIVFGYGNSNSFIERMRITNSGRDGLFLNGRINLRNGSIPIDLNDGPGIWLSKADNSGQLGFMGTQNNQNIGFYGGPGGWGFTYNALNSRVGIGNNNPNAPLSFAATLEKKITLYPGATGDVGLGVSGNRLQIYSDNPNADVAIGYDAAGVFNERFAVKANGALAVVGNTGAAGQVLQSNGSAAATWGSGTNSLFNSTVDIRGTNSVSMSSYTLTDVPGLTYSFTTSGNAKLLVNLNIACYAGTCAFCGTTQVDLRLNLDGSDVSLHRYIVPNGEDPLLTGSKLLPVGAGNHTLKLRVATTGPAIFIGIAPSVFENDMIVQVIPE
ncbi:MAG: hypothetical protein ABIN67_04410 [Ferruginibacter sp.]